MNSIEEIIEDLKNGRMVIMMDDEDRENEGDLVMAAEFVRPEDINFMARYARGLICLTLTRDHCRQLRLPLMVDENVTPHGTNFTVSIEAAEGVTTGISAHDRARTIQAAVAPEARPEDVVQPGHIFPLMAQPGGVLSRAGHTEAGCDLARMAGMQPAAAIVEILNEDGSMARRPDLEKFAAEHGLKLGTIADLIRYRLKHERSIERVAESRVNTAHGEFRLVIYEDAIAKTVHMAMVRGEIHGDTPTLVRVHLRNTLGDVLGVEEPRSSMPLSHALRTVAEEGTGVVVVLRQWETPQSIVQQVMEMGRQSEPAEAADADVQDLRTYGIGAQILADLGVRRMRVLSAPKRMHALSGFDLEVEEYVQND